MCFLVTSNGTWLLIFPRRMPRQLCSKFVSRKPFKKYTLAPAVYHILLKKKSESGMNLFQPLSLSLFFGLSLFKTPHKMYLYNNVWLWKSSNRAARSRRSLKRNKHMSIFVVTKLMVAEQANQIEILVTISLKLLKYNLTSDKGGCNL